MDHCIDGRDTTKSAHKNGAVYAVVFRDLFTKRVEIQATQKANAKTIKKVFHDLIICGHGTPKIIITDNSSEFANKLITYIAKEFGINQTIIPVYHAQLALRNGRTKPLIT